MANRARFGDWTKGLPRDSTTYNVSYEFDVPGGIHEHNTVKTVVVGGPETAGRRIHQRILKCFPKARITIKQIWEPGKTPGGLILPQGTEWIDDGVEGKGKKSR